MSLTIQPLDAKVTRDFFDCGIAQLNDFIKTKARQNQEKGLNRTFVLLNSEDKQKKVLGFYSLSSSHVDVSSLPIEEMKKLPKHPVPVVRIGRLAVDLSQSKKGYGELLLVDSLKRVKEVSNQIGIFAVIVDAKDGHAVSFYLKYGFQKFRLLGNALFLPLRAVP